MDEQNPYRSSSAEILDEVLVHHVESASKLRRFFNWLIDKLMVVGLIVLATLLALLVGDEQAITRWIDEMSSLTDYVITYAFTLIYYTGMEGLFGVTIGKLVTGTRVVDAQGRRLTFYRGLLRSLCRFIPFDALSLLFSDDDVRRAWHDSITKTYVVRRRQVRRELVVQSPTTSDSTTMSST